MLSNERANANRTWQQYCCKNCQNEIGNSIVLLTLVLGFEFRVIFLLDWLPTKATLVFLSCYADVLVGGFEFSFLFIGLVAQIFYP